MRDIERGLAVEESEPWPTSNSKFPVSDFSLAAGGAEISVLIPTEELTFGNRYTHVHAGP